VKEYLKYFIQILGGFVLIAVIFLLTRSVDVFFFKFLSISTPSVIISDYVTGFNGYRDFITVTTGLLAIIIGATGIGAYLSYKKIKGEESRLTKLRTKFEILLKIEEGRVGSDSESDPESAVRAYRETGMDFDDYHVLYLLRGEAFYKRGKDGDYTLAERDYKKALDIVGTSAKAWFGLGQAKFRSVLGRMEYREPVELDVSDVARFKISNNHFSAQGNDIERVEEAIRYTENAISCGYDRPTALFEVGKMYESIGKPETSLALYKDAYYLNTNNSANGFYYAFTWIKVNVNNLSLNVINENGIVRVLKQVGMMNLFHSKAAYALLWFLYCVVPGLGSDADKRNALAATSQYVVNDIFEL